MSEATGTVTQILFTCDNCGSSLSAREGEEGAEFDCPECGEVQTVPSEFDEEIEIEEHENGEIEKTSSKKKPAPRKTITIPAKETLHDYEEEDDFEDADVMYEVGGPGLRMFAVAVGSVGLILCGISLVWAVMQVNAGEEVNVLLLNLAFASTFLVGLMGLVMAKLCFVVLHIAARLARDLDRLSPR